MESIALGADLTAQAITISLSCIRIAVAFSILPLFSEELIPPLIRNSIFLSFAAVSSLLQPAIDVSQFNAWIWMAVVSKEFVVGISIGVFYGAFLWAFEAAGQIIDAQIGMNMAQIFDPLEGHQTSLIGAFLGRFVNFAFIAMGGLMYLVGTIFESYHYWPVGDVSPDWFKLQSMNLFIGEFKNLFELIVVVAAPVLVICFMIDVCMGMINRESPQFNVYFLSMPIKTLAAVFALILSLTYIIEMLAKLLAEHKQSTIAALTALFGG